MPYNTKKDRCYPEFPSHEYHRFSILHPFEICLGQMSERKQDQHERKNADGDGNGNGNMIDGMSGC